MVISETLEAMLKPYYPECRYLLKAELDFPIIKGIFSIPKTFYGDQSGHFNATELMMCYNQICYTFFAESFDQGLVESVGRISLEEFKTYQMGSCLIATLNNIKFRKPINPKNFFGELTLKKSLRRNDFVFLTTDFSFRDNHEGKATGEAMLTLVLKPQKNLVTA